MSTETLTDKRCLSSRREWLSKCEAIYARSFPSGGQRSDLFWSKQEDSAGNFFKALEKRPITQMEISHLVRVAISEFTVICSQEKKVESARSV